jgi:hypothetical protein
MEVPKRVRTRCTAPGFFTVVIWDWGDVLEEAKPCRRATRSPTAFLDAFWDWKFLHSRLLIQISR